MGGPIRRENNGNLPVPALTEMDYSNRKPNWVRRFRVARCLDDAALRQLAAAVRFGSTASLELVFSGGRRERVARGVHVAQLRALASAAAEDGVHLELVFTRAGRSRPRSGANEIG
jgi:hypothetical protein